MPSWTKSFWIVFWSIIAGFLITIFWIVIAGLVLNSFFMSYIRSIDIEYIEYHFTQYGLAGIYNLPGSLIDGLVVILIFSLAVIFLSSLSFFGILVKYTWNAIYKELKKDLTK